MDFKGARTVITGGSRGLGAALGAELASRGARVVLVARDERALRTTVGEIRARGGEAHGLAWDVASEEAPYAIAGAAAGLVGPIDILVHGASSLGPTPLPALLDTDSRAFEDVLRTNLVAPFRLTRAVAGSMALRGRGLVVHVTSDASVVPYPGWGAYGVSKAGLDHLARIWGEELRGTGVRFLSVDPGEMDTEMHAAAVPGADRRSLAAPTAVARRIADLLGDESLPTGARIEVASSRPAA
jgi:NAD(P)-dependent dehydrogenase (short-subunit alcohol dehydrogenase family)